MKIKEATNLTHTKSVPVMAETFMNREIQLCLAEFRFIKSNSEQYWEKKISFSK